MSIEKNGQAYKTGGHVPCQMGYDPDNDLLVNRKVDSDGRTYALINQNITTSTVNTTTTNLAAGATFTGEAESTLGINGLQFFARADQPLRVYLEQSVDGTTWDISDYWDTLANVAEAQILLSVAPYFRLKVTNMGTSATTDLDVAAGMTPIINPLPRKLSPDSRLSVETTIIGQQNTDRHAWITPQNAQVATKFIKLVGSNFDGTTKDTRFWTETVANGGTVTQSGGEIELDTNTTANGSAIYDSIRVARFAVPSTLQWQAIIKYVTAGTANNVRRFGAFDVNDGFFFELNGTTFSVGYRKATADTLVNNGNFNGNYGPSWTVDETAYHKFAIEWGPKGIFFYIDGVLVHKDGQGHRSNKLSLPIRIQNTNSGGSTTNVALDCLATATGRYGELETNPTYYHISGNAATHTLKLSPGILHSVVYNNTSGTSLTIYDGDVATGTVIGVITTASAALGSWKYDVPFNRGLTCVTVGNSLDATIIYE